MATVMIELEFDSEDVSDADVINYLNELIENDMLDYEVKGEERTLSNHSINEDQTVMIPNAKDFASHLRNQLIPDLKESGQDQTAQDFETCLLFVDSYIHEIRKQEHGCTDAFCSVCDGDHEHE